MNIIEINITPNQAKEFNNAMSLSVIPLPRGEDMEFVLYLAAMNRIMYLDNFGPVLGMPEPTTFTAKGQVSKYCLSFLNWEPGATPIHYSWTDGEWRWSPDDNSWMPVSTSTVTEGIWAGHQPVPGNVELIKALCAVKPVLIVQSIDEKLPSFVIINSSVVQKLDHMCLIEEFASTANVRMLRVWKNKAIMPHPKMVWLFKANTVTK